MGTVIAPDRGGSRVEERPAEFSLGLRGELWDHAFCTGETSDTE